MRIQAIPLALSLTLIAVPGLPFAAAAVESPAELTAQATISLQDAITPALAEVPGGKIQYAELEKENDSLVWFFAIAMPNSVNITMVNVDAKTGAIVSSWIETPADRAEAEANDAYDAVDESSGGAADYDTP
jgi:hypothetical protein